MAYLTAINFLPFVRYLERSKTFHPSLDRLRRCKRRLRCHFLTFDSALPVNASVAQNARASDAKTPQPSVPEPVDTTVPTDNVACYAAKITPIISTVRQPMRPAINTVEPLRDYTTFSISGKQPASILLKTLSDAVENQNSINISIPTIQPSVRYCF
jgi:hypothetical protein